MKIENFINNIKSSAKYLALLSLILGEGILMQSCNYLDVVPDKIGTIDNSFTNRNEAEKYLYTCYSYLPGQDSPYENLGMMGSDELWSYYPITTFNDYAPFKIALGFQNVNDPLSNKWYVYYRAIRDCNIFLDNVADMSKVADLAPTMRKRWLAEVKFLKAYYHFYLFRMYGPIVIMDENLPISSTPEEVRMKREPVDKVVEYISDLLDESVNDLPKKITNAGSEMGRITQIAALTLKAKLLLTAASPLFNGNPDYANYTDKDGQHLFSSTVEASKWDDAIAACEAAIRMSEDPEVGLKLYKYESNLILSDATKCQLSIRNSFSLKWNSELIWGLSGRSGQSLQNLSMTRVGAYPNNMWGGQEMLNPTLEVTNLCYTKNGVPMEEDKAFDTPNRFKVKMHTNEQPYELASYYETIQLNFNREPRFYANIGFDGCTWYQTNCPTDSEKDIWTAKNRAGQPQGKLGSFSYTTTGYWPKKLVSVAYEVTQNGYTTERYPWPELRLTDLYLMYAEALNEKDDAGNRTLAISYLDQIRERAGLKGIVESWTKYSKYPDKYNTQKGLREIIQRERSIELMFEGSRFWDLRRWKTANQVLNQKLHGWNYEGETPAEYYTSRTLYLQKFVAPRDYFWPIHANDLVVNPKLVQNPGWGE